MLRRTRGVAHLVAGPARPNLGVRFRVMPGSLRFALPTTRLDLNSHEASGRPEGQAASIKQLTAFDAKGKPVSASFVGKGA